jgi:hypothetical protein
MDAVDTSTEKGAARQAELRIKYEALGQEIKSLNKEAKDRETTIQKTIQLQTAEENSINQLRRQLELATIGWTNMKGSADASTKELKEQQKVVADLKEKLNKAEQAYGTFTGNYAKAGQSLKSELEETITKLAELKFAASNERGGIIYIPVYVEKRDEKGVFVGLEYKKISNRIAWLSIFNFGSDAKFSEEMYFNGRIAKYYQKYQEIIRQPKVIEATFLLDELDLHNIDLLIPVYLEQTGQYYAIIDINVSDKSAKCKLLQM